MKFCKFFISLSFFLMATCTCFAINTDEFKLSDDFSLESCTVIDNKIYLKPEMIYVTLDQILLKYRR